MNMLKDAFARAGFDTQRWDAAQRAGIVPEARRELMKEQGLKPRCEPIRQVRVCKGVVRTSGGLQVCEDVYKGRS